MSYLTTFLFEYIVPKINQYCATSHASRKVKFLKELLVKSRLIYTFSDKRDMILYTYLSV